MAKFTLSEDALTTLRNWLILLRSLSFTENFKGYEWEGSIASGEEVKISHPLKVTPTRFLVTEARGTPLVVSGDTRATSAFYYIKNIDGTLDFTGKILILP